MAKVVNFKNDADNEISLYEWTYRLGEFGNRSEDELKELFLNMDKAMKYVHTHGYCIKSFSPLEIQILNNSPKQIKFNTVLEMPNDATIKNQLQKEDVFNSTCLQIGIYTNTLKYLDVNYLKEHFEDFAKSLPANDIPYYRGVIERGAGVYFCEYVNEQRKRDLEQLNKEIDALDGGNSNAKQYVKTNGLGYKMDDNLTNDAINDNIYRQINGLKDAAFINYFIIPMIIFIMGIALILVFLMTKMS